MIRTISYIITILCGWFLNSALLTPTSTVVSNNASLATVNGGNEAYVVQKAVSTTMDFPWFLIFFLIVTALFWFSPVKALIKKASEENA